MSCLWGLVFDPMRPQRRFLSHLVKGGPLVLAPLPQLWAVTQAPSRREADQHLWGSGHCSKARGHGGLDMLRESCSFLRA